MTLTTDGERLVPYARRALDAQDELLAAFEQARPCSWTSTTQR